MRRPARRQRRRFYPDLATYIDESGDTQQRIAKACGTTQAHISRIAAGDAIPRPELAERIVAYAHIPLDSFVRASLARRRSA